MRCQVVSYTKLSIKHEERAEVLKCAQEYDSRKGTLGKENSMYSNIFYKFRFKAKGDKQRSFEINN